MHDFAPENAGDLELKVGDVVTVLSEDASGWWTGVNIRSGERGLFPVVFTELKVASAGDVVGGGPVEESVD